MIKKIIYNSDNHTILYPTQTINLSKKLMKQINNENHIFFSGTPTIIELPNNEFLVNIRWINYKLNNYGFILPINDVKHNNIKNLNSRFKVNSLFQPISKEIFLDEDLTYKPHMIGIEDIRIFNFNNTYYYNATILDANRHVHSTTSQIYPIEDNTYKLERPIIMPTQYDTTSLIIPEKNWSFVNYKNELCVVHLWFPLQIGKIDYTTNELKIIETQKMPSYFQYTRGSTAGYTKKDEIWFVVHKTHDKNYVHFFVIFDLHMQLLRYSEPFKFKNYKVEFCIGLIVQDKQVILSYSVMDTQSFISVYTIKYLQQMKWFTE
jgi:predicted GH43/DUF377 family glycosyl hydrolase